MKTMIATQFRFWNESPDDENGVRCDADKLIDGLNTLIGYGGSLRANNLDSAIPEPQRILVNTNGDPLEPAEPCWTESPIQGLQWTVQDVLTVRPDLHREEAYGVLREIAMLANFGSHICPETIKAIADETFTAIESKPS